MSPTPHFAPDGDQPRLFEPEMPDRIDSFDGDFAFLSNFHPSPVVFDGELYATVEAAFQAAKTTDAAERATIRTAATPGRAKRLGRRVTLRPGWDDMRVDVMTTLVRAKFADPEFAAALVATGDAVLVEGNTWGDRFWGVCRGVGHNHLGRILMAVRSELTS